MINYLTLLYEMEPNAIGMMRESMRQFMSRPDAAAEYKQLNAYTDMLRDEMNVRYDRKIDDSEFYCLLRGAMGFDHPSMRDERAPYLPILNPYIRHDLSVLCKKPKAVTMKGHIVIPHQLNIENNTNNVVGGTRRRRYHKRSRRSNRRRTYKHYK